MNDQRATPGPAESGPVRGPHRSPLALVVAIAVTLSGLVWILQGLGILTAGGSFMIGDQKWTVIGGAFVILGLFLGVRARRRA